MTWADAAAIPWHQWIVMTFGAAGVVMSQIEATQRYACWPGLTGQFGWLAALEWTPAQYGMCVVSVICCCAWMWGMYRYWLAGWIDTVTTPTVGPGTTRPRSGGTTKPRLRRVK